MVRIGIVGIGFMGMIHFYAAKKLRGAKVTAISTRNPAKLAGDWSSIQGNFGPRGKPDENLKGVAKYEEINDLLADPKVDLVDICLPTEQHADVAIAALQAGKDVLVEKSISLTLKDADRMLAAAKKAKRHLMVAHVLPFFPEFAFARQAIQSKKLGRLLSGHFKRIISKPTWSADIASLEKTGGPAVDLHIHDTHFIGLICGVPDQVYARGLSERGYVTHLTTHYIYDSMHPAITCSSGAICQSGRPFVHGYELFLDKGTLLYESGVQPLTVLTPDGKSTQPKLGSPDPIVAFTSELQHAVDVVSKGANEAELSGTLARNALLLCHKEIQSVLTGKQVRVR